MGKSKKTEAFCVKDVRTLFLGLLLIGCLFFNQLGDLVVLPPDPLLDYFNDSKSVLNQAVNNLDSNLKVSMQGLSSYFKNQYLIEVGKITEAVSLEQKINSSLISLSEAVSPIQCIFDPVIWVACGYLEVGNSIVSALGTLVSQSQLSLTALGFNIGDQFEFFGSELTAISTDTSDKIVDFYDHCAEIIVNSTFFTAKFLTNFPGVFVDRLNGLASSFYLLISSPFELIDEL